MNERHGQLADRQFVCLAALLSWWINVWSLVFRKAKQQSESVGVKGKQLWLQAKHSGVLLTLMEKYIHDPDIWHSFLEWRITCRRAASEHIEPEKPGSQLTTTEQTYLDLTIKILQFDPCPRFFFSYGGRFKFCFKSQHGDEIHAKQKRPCKLLFHIH